MYNYKKLYYGLFNQITDAIEALERHEFQDALDLLVRAQQEAEEHYLSDFDDPEDE